MKKEIYRVKETKEIIPFPKLKAIIEISRTRMKKLSEIVELADFFFKKKLTYPAELLKWKEMTNKELKRNLEILFKELNKLSPEEFTEKRIKETLMPLTKKYGTGQLLWPLRVALSGKKASPGPFEIAEILGKNKTLERIQNALTKL